MAVLDENTFIKAYEEMENSSKQLKPTVDAYPILEMMSGAKQGLWFSLKSDGDITLGRANINQIILEDNSVSRSHALVRNQGGTITLRDIGSRNGTYVNQKKILTESVINHLDIIKVGIYTLRLLKSPVETQADEEEYDDRTPPPRLKTVSENKVEDVKKEVVEEEAAAVSAAAQAVAEVPQTMMTSGSTPSVATAPKAKKGVPLFPILILVLLVGLAVSVWFTQSKWMPWLASKFNHKSNQTITVKNNQQISTNQVTQNTTQQQNQEHRLSVMVEANATPIAAKIFYEGKELGQTPFQISLRVPENKAVELVAEFQLTDIGETVRETKSIVFSQADELKKIEFGTQLGTLYIDQLPKSATMYLEGAFEQQGFKSKVIPLNNIAFGKAIYTPFGKYVVEVRELQSVEGTNNAQPKIKYRRDFILSSATKDYHINVNEEDIKTFPASITSDPDKAQLLLDGKKIGETPYKGNLPLGQHKLVIRKDGFEDKVDQLSMELNAPFAMNYRLGTTPAGNYINLGRDSLRRGDANAAIEKLIEALKHSPDKTELGQIHFYLGQSFLKSQNFEQAQGYFEKAMKDPVMGPLAELGLAESYHKLGDSGQALSRIVNVVLNTQDQKLLSDAHTLYNKLFPIKSTLYVNTEPAGATVSVNGTVIGQVSPIILSDLMVGNYRVKVELDGYKPVETRFLLEISTIKPLIIKLEKN